VVRAPLWLAGAAAFAAVAVLVGALVGPVNLGVGGVLHGTFAHAFGLHSPLSPTDDAILWQVRLPRVVLGGIVGATLALSGAAYQGVFRNPLADPYLLGAAAGAGLGATLAVVYGPSGGFSSDLVPIAAFVGASLAVVAAYVSLVVGAPPEVRDSVALGEHEAADEIPALDGIVLDFDHYGRLVGLRVTDSADSILSPSLIEAARNKRA